MMMRRLVAGDGSTLPWRGFFIGMHTHSYVCVRVRSFARVTLVVGRRRPR